MNILNKNLSLKYDIIVTLINGIVVIGGINLNNIDRLSSTHADMIAISSGLFDEGSSSDTASALIGRLRELNVFF